MNTFLRVLSGLAGATLFLLAGVLTAGTALVAPLGMLLMKRRALRLNRPLSRVASLVGAVMASSVAALLLCIVFFAVVPRSTIRQMERQTAESQTQPTIRLPSWYGRVFPQAARADSATRQLVRSREFVLVGLIFGAVAMSLLFGLIGGGTGWGAATLVVYAWRGAV